MQIILFLKRHHLGKCSHHIFVCIVSYNILWRPKNPTLSHHKIWVASSNPQDWRLYRPTYECISLGVYLFTRRPIMHVNTCAYVSTCIIHVNSIVYVCNCAYTFTHIQLRMRGNLYIHTHIDVHISRCTHKYNTHIYTLLQNRNILTLFIIRIYVIHASQMGLPTPKGQDP